METFMKKNMGILIFYLVLIGGIMLINEKFANPSSTSNNIIAINK